MRLQKLLHSVGTNFDRLYKWQWGYVVLSTSIGVLVILLGILEGERSAGNLFSTAFFYGPFLTAIAFLIKKYGWEGFASKTIEVSIKILMKLLSIVLIPFVFIFNLVITTPYKFLITLVPEKLPFVLRPLYQFCWNLLFAGAAYYICWLIFSTNSQPSDFGSINIYDQSYKVVISGAEIAGFILFLGFFKFLFAYLRMLGNWLDKFKWQIKFVINH